MSLNFQARMVTSPIEVGRRILDSLSQEVTARFNSLMAPIQAETQRLLQLAVEGSPEYQSLLNGTLRTELGVVDPFQALSALTTDILSSVNMSSTGVKTKMSRITGTLRLTAVPDNVADSARHLATYVTKKGATIPWLDWLLTAGDKVIVRDYEVDFSFSERSRTGGAIMVFSGSKGWRVPPEYSGSEGNNFITRSVDSITPDLERYITQTFRKKFA